MDIPAILRMRARDWASWNGWRRHGPAAGSVAVHLVLVAVIAAMLGTAGASDAPARPRPPPTMELAFIPIEATPEPEPRAGVTPPRAPRPTPLAKTAGDNAGADTVPDPRKKRERAAPVPDQTVEADTGGEYAPPSILLPQTGAKGLQALAYGDPCASRFGKKPKECVDNWAARVGEMDSVMPRSKAELAQFHGDFMPKCRWKVGCEPGEWISTNGTRAPQDNTSAASGGPASLGGIHDLVGRLPPNPDFVDPGFGD